MEQNITADTRVLSHQWLEHTIKKHSSTIIVLKFLTGYIPSPLNHKLHYNDVLAHYLTIEILKHDL